MKKLKQVLIYELENKISSLQKNMIKLNSCPVDKQKYFKKCFNEGKYNLQNTLNEFGQYKFILK